MNEWMDGWMNQWMNEWSNEWMNEWMNEWSNEGSDEWMDEWMEEWINEWMIEWMIEWMNGYQMNALKTELHLQACRQPQINLVADPGFEPMTFGFITCCTTNWAREMGMLIMSVNGHKKLTLVMCQATVVVMNNWLNEWVVELIN